MNNEQLLNQLRELHMKHDGLSLYAVAADRIEGLLNGWLRAIDEALVVSHLDVANADDTYEVAKSKLNKLLVFEQELGAFMAAKDPVYLEVRCSAHPNWMRVEERQYYEYVLQGWEGRKLYAIATKR